jgi:hypothetical protein
MAVELWAASVLASCVLLVIPLSTILTVISYSVTHGIRANVPLVAAVALGDSTALDCAIELASKDSGFTDSHLPVVKSSLTACCMKQQDSN